MNESRAVSRMLLLLLAAFALAGCADELAEPQTVVDDPRPESVVQSGTNAPDGESSPPPQTIEFAKAEVGVAAPEFAAIGLDGESVSLSDYIGEQNVVLAFSRGNW